MLRKSFEPRDTTMNIRLSTTEKNLITIKATEQGKTVSRYIREVAQSPPDITWICIKESLTADVYILKGLYSEVSDKGKPKLNIVLKDIMDILTTTNKTTK